MVTSFAQLKEQVKGESQKAIAVAMAEDKDVLSALEKARSEGLTQAVLFGKAKNILKILHEIGADKNDYEIVAAGDENSAVKQAVNFVKENRAQVLMKGMCSTGTFLKAVLDKTDGLRSGKVISHLAVFESPEYHKLLLMSDAAMNIAPDLATKITITENAVAAARRLGYDKCKVAIISAVEKVNPEGIPSSVDAAVIAKMADRGQIKDAIVDGPLALDNALSLQSCLVKGLTSPVGGDADICIVPNIETGNVFYKLLTVLGNAKVGGIIVGARTPIVLTSRADSEQSKFYSILTALKAG